MRALMRGRNILGRLGDLALPCVLLAATLAAALNLPRTAPWIAGMPVVAAIAAGIVGWRFRQGRIAVAALALLIATAFLEVPVVTRAPWNYLPGLVLLYLSLALGILGLMRERGLLNGHGIVRLGLVIWPAVAVVLISADPPLLRGTMAALASGSGPLGLSIAVMVLIVLATVVLIVRWLRAPMPLAAAELVAFASACIGAVSIVNKGAVSWLGASNLAARDTAAIWLAGAGLILLAGVLQTAYRLAFLDELTGLPGRRALRSLYAGLSRDYVIAMCDIDHFKSFNDTYGHDVGDQVLQKVAGTIGKVTGGGRPFRYGGEEFTIVFPGKTMAYAEPHLEAVRQMIEATPFEVRKPPPKRASKNAPKPSAPKQVQITISIGVAQRTEELTDPDQVMKAADTALYRAKKKGRNQVSR